MKGESFVYIAKVLQMTTHSGLELNLGASVLGKLACDGTPSGKCPC